MAWRAIRTGLGLSLIGLLVMAVQVQALECGDTILEDTRLRHHLIDCPGDGLIIGAPGITLNLNHKRITGSGGEGTAGVVVDGVDDVTIRNGTVRNFGFQVFIRQSNDLLVRHMTLSGPAGIGIRVDRSNDVEVRYSRIRDLSGSGVSVFSGHDFILRHSRIANVGTNSGGAGCDGGVGVSTFNSSDVTIRNNLFKRISRSGIIYANGLRGRILRNTIVQTSSDPCHEDFGAITIRGGAQGTVVAYNRILGNAYHGIGLEGQRDIEIRKNRLRFNLLGIFFTAGASDVRVKHNCISHNDTRIGLEIDRENGASHTVDARRNYWGARNGPSGDGPLGTEL